ncbi:hypothetical protein ASE14_07580 [Agromyces sp. Root81]|uniref:hypothetical protein n=1 Tax=Agromyces sp. Root81 TaxID=1736601 RepID=UPI0006FBD3D8|nr:hypothetical protein [Agromyces sp. Root81]KRC60823.1 hypothetical protein ASE14_07580 [Agromyces sp. Root81]
MAGPDIDLDFDDLTSMTKDLSTFVTEFENIGDTTDDVKDAVGRPHGRTQLERKVGDFEGGWDGNREVILDGLTNIRDHLQAIVDQFTETDKQLATSGETS